MGIIRKICRLNSRQRKRIYKKLVKRNAEKCNKCGRKPPEVKKLVIDRIDNQGDYKDLNKLQLLCYRCNYLKNPRNKKQQPLDNGGVGVGEDVKEKVDFGYESSISINREKEPLFYPYVDQRLEESPNGVVDADDLEYSSAWDLELSQRTTAKYLKKACSSAGPYELFKDGKTRQVRRKKP